MMNNYMRTFYMLALFLLTYNANALNITVTSIADSGAGTLRQAMLNVNAAGAGPHTITFSPALSGQTINIATNLPTLTVSGVSINGDINNDNIPDITIDAGTGNNTFIIFQGTAAANNTTIKGFVLQDMGDTAIKFTATVSGITIQDIVVKHTENNFIDKAIWFVGNVSSLTVTNVTVSQIENTTTRFAFYVQGTTTNTVIDNFNVSNSGMADAAMRFTGAANTVTIKNTTLDLDNSAGIDDGNYGIVFGSTTTDVNLTDIKVLSCDIQGLYLSGAATRVEMTRYTFTAGGSGTGSYGIYIIGVMDTVTIDAANVSLDVPGNTDDGEYGFYFYNNATNTVIKNSVIHDAESQAIFFRLLATTVNISDTTIDNLEGDTDVYGINFNGISSGVTLTNVTVDGAKNIAGNDGDYGIYFNGNTSNVTMNNVKALNFDGYGIRFVGTANTVAITDYNFTNGRGGTGSYGINFNGAATGITMSNLSLNMDNPTGADDGSYGIYFNSTATTVNITDVSVMRADFRGIHFLNNANGINITRYTYTSGATAGVNVGLSFATTADNVTIDTAILNMDVPGSTNDGDYGMEVVGAASNFIIKNSTIHDAEVVGIYLRAAATTVNILDTTIDNLEGHVNAQGIQFSGISDGITLTNVTIDGAMTVPGNDGNYGVIFNSNVLNSTLTNVKTLNIDTYGLWFNGTTNTVAITDYTFTTGRGGSASHAIRFEQAATGITMTNILLDMDNPTSNVDGNLGIYFVNTASSVNINGFTIHDAESNGIFVNLAATDFTLLNGVLDNFDGSGAAYMIQFNNNTTNVTITDVTINGDVTGTTDDANYGLYFNSSVSNNVKLTRVNLTEVDLGGFYFLNANDYTIDNCNITKSNNYGIQFEGNTSRSNNEIKNSTFDESGHTALKIVTDNATNAFNIHNNTFSNGTGPGIGVWLAGIGGVKNIQITNNIFSNNTGQGIYNEKADGVLYSLNTYFNNAKGGIDNVTADGNDGLEKSTGKSITILSSKNGTVAGTYDVTFIVPSFCTNCNIEFYGNLPTDVKDNGRTYVKTETALAAGTYTRTLTYAGDATGYWTATLRDFSQNASVSEFSASALIQNVGPAGVTNGLGAWWRADRDATATTWKDYSGNGHDLVTTGTIVLTTNSVNFNPAMRFNGSYFNYNNSPIFAAPVNYDNVYIFAVGIPKDGGNLSFIMERSNSGTNDFRFYKWTTEAISFGAPSNIQQTTADYRTLGGITNVPNLFGAKKTPAYMTSLLQGKEIGTPLTGPFTSYSSTGAFNYVGAIASNPSTANSEIAELIVYSNASAITPLEIQKVNSYLALKYGISLDQTTATDYLASDGTTKMWNAAVNALYSKDIAGIGRDDASALLQKQSAAVDPAEVVTIGYGGIAASNDANTATFASDKTFLVWGHDTGNLTLKTTELPSGANAELRYNREWKVQETGGNVNNLTIRFKNIPTSVANLELYIDTDNDGDFTNATIYPGTLAGTTVTFTGIDLNNNDSFTLGYSAVYPGGVSTAVLLWLKADADVVGTTAVTSWADQSGNLKNADIAVSDPELIQGAVNYNPVVNFDGNDYLAFTNNSFVTGFTAAEAIAVVKNNGNGLSSGHPYDFGGSSREFTYTWSDRNVYQGSFTTDRIGFNPLLNTISDAKAGVTAVTGNFIDTKDWNIYDTQSAANQYTIQFNGLTKINTTTNTTNFSLGVNKELIGATGNFYFTGDIGEVILYNRVLTSLERQRVNSYTALKYGITLDQTTPTDYLASNGTTKSWDATANALYSNDIAGIGRDDATALNQKQSRSVNSDAIVSIGLGTLATTNQLNTNTFSADKNFLVWGNDNASLELQTTERPAAASASTIYRLGREWKVKETGPDTGLLSISFTNVHPQATNIELYVDTDGDGDFTNATVITGGTLVGKTVTFTGVNLNNNNLFTLGYTAVFPGAVPANLGLWLKADAGTGGVNENDAVGTWLDQSLKTLDAVAVGDPTFEFTNGTNFNPTIYHDGNDGHNPATSVKDQYTFLTMSKLSGTKNARIFKSNVGNFLAGYWQGKEDVLYLDGTPNLLTGKAATTNPHLYTLKRQTSGAYDMYSAGKSLYTGTTSANSTIDLDISGNTEPSAAYVSEAILYERALSALETQKVETYLAIKYGVTLDQTTPYDYIASNGTTKIWDTSGKGAYKNNIAGIGRDDLSGLNQKQSKSINTNAFLTIGLGTIAANNIANTNTFVADKNFLVWANDSGSLSPQTGDLPGVATAIFRIGREWKVQETGSISNLTVTVNSIPDSSYNLELYVDKDGDGVFTSGTIVKYAGTLVNGTATFTGVDLDNNDVFTIGYTNLSPGGVPAGLGAWWRADKNATTTTWADYSGNGYDATKASAGTLTLNTGSANFNPSYNLSGSYFEYPAGKSIFASPNNYDNIYVFAVGIPKAGQNLSVWSERATQGYDAAFFKLNNNSLYLDAPYGYRLSNVFLTGGGVNDIPNLIAGRKTPTSFTNYIQGKAAATVTGTYVTYSSNNSTALNRIGATSGYISNGGSELSEVIVYKNSSAMTATDAQQINSYLAIKYGITLDQTVATDYLATDGTKIWDATANAAYSFDITGIGRDDFTSLVQKQSKSVNLDNVVTIGLGAIAADNSSNTNSFTGDKSYLVWGNDNAPVALQTTERPAAASVNTIYRLGREWKVQETGDDTGPLAIAFNNIHPSATSIELYVDTDGDGNFANATVITGGVLVGKTVTFSGVNLKNNDLFTVGYTVPFPGGVTGSLAVWLKADADVLGTTAVTSWGDQTTNVRDANIAVSDPELVEGGLNYNPVIRFDGDDYFRFSTSPFVSSFTAAEAITVLKNDGVGVNSGHPYDFGGSVRGFHYIHSNNNIYQGSFTTDRVGFNPLLNTIVDTKAGVTSATGDFVDTADWNIYGTHSAANVYGVQFNGQPKISSTTSNVVNFNLTANRETIGETNATYFTGDIGEVILYSRVLTDLERQRVNSYTALKYGITLNQTIPYDYIASDGTTKIWDATANALYNNDIAGIGRDDLTALSQKQSRSVNSDALVTIGLGTITATNQLNAGSFPVDRSFLVWGNDNASVNLQTTERPVAANAVFRVGREWKISKIGTVGPVTIALSNVPINAMNVELYIDTDGDSNFTNATVITGGVVSGGVVTFSGVMLNNNDRFTYGYTAPFPGGVSPNLGLWLKANEGTGGVNQNDPIGVWTDQSPAAAHGVAVGDPTYELTNGTNFNPAVYYDGDDGHDPVTAFKGQYTMFSLARYSGTANRRIYKSNVGNIIIGYYNGREDVLYLDNNPNFSTAGKVATTNPNLYTLKRQASGAYDMYTSGKSLYTGTSSANSTINLNIAGNSEPAAAYVSETIMYGRDLNAVEIQQVESYLALKYGMSLDQTTPRNYLASDGITVSWNSAANGIYKNDIAGIGRDDLTALSQKQSRSSNTADIVTIGLKEIAEYNHLNTGVFAVDRNFLTWGNNGASTATQTTEKPTVAAATYRIGREWKVTEVGSLSNFTIAFKDIPTTASNFELYIDTDGDGDFTNATKITTGISFASEVVTFSGVDLNNGDVFTLGYSILSPGGVITGLGAWWRADKNASTTAWSDFSGNGHNAVNNGTVVLNPATVNFNPAFALTNSFFEYVGNPIFVGGNNYDNMYVFSVGIPKAGQHLSVWSERSNNGANDASFFKYSNNNLYMDAPYTYRASNVFVTKGGVNDKPNLMAGKKTPTTITNFIQGKEAVTATGTYVSRSSATAGLFNRIGATSAYVSGGGSQLAEVIVYKNSSAMTPTQELQVNSYLALKYGITLDQSPPTDYLASDGITKMWNASATYANDIAGIGRDDTSALNQKQSRSVNADALITMSLGALATDNASNTNTFGSDKSFLVWGNDNVSTTLQKTERPSIATCSHRMGREWKVSKAGTVGPVSVTVFDIPSIATNIELFIDSDGDSNFTTGTIVKYTGTLVGRTATFSGVNFANNDVFTIGYSAISPGGVLAGMGAWWRADLEASVTNWNDYSGNTHDAVNTGTISLNPSGVNFNSSLGFDGASFYQYPTSVFTGSGVTYNDMYVFSVGIPESGKYLSVWCEKATTGVDTRLFKNNTDNNVYFDAPSPTRAFANLAPGEYSKPNLMSGKRSTTNIVTYAQGKQTASVATAATTLSSDVSASRSSRIGSLSSTGISGAGTSLSEVVVYKNTTMMTVIDELKVNSYLAIKYGITLDQTTPTNYISSEEVIAWNAAVNSVFKHDITVIGRDDISVLNQKQSKSSNGDDIITIGLGPIATTNALNTNSFSANNDFLSWSNNDASPSIVLTSGIPAGFDKKISRNWLVQETGNVGEVTIQIPASALTGFPSKTDLVLIVADDSGFTTNLVTSPFEINGSNYEAKFDFSGNKYFTVGILLPDFMRHGKYFRDGVEQPMKF
ncbi:MULTISPECIES: right-handed parallel beta-helix repeat-containing protein [Flavobacterium]|uniref:right-handed parallel beta-helix repeat-containing protein n=1 Tax=Flavobacterium TaxID=237 RepID=UPI002114F7C5|nr:MULTISPECIES: right-handed parallel beta-helix repeat-containing protein [Flavobacterium]UUF12406.1 right-handed parallel beta-helix repeat-containing protein [Flavobacterium panici]